VPTFTVLDPAGTVVRHADGQFVDAGPEGTLLVRTDFEPRGDIDGVRVVGERLPKLEIESLAGDTPPKPVSVDAMRLDPRRADTVVGVLDLTCRQCEDIGLSAENRGVLIEAPGRARIVLVDGSPIFVDLASNGRFAVLHDVANLMLVVVDLSTEEIHRLPVGPGRIVAVDLR
jgi:hypothetical protein